VNSWAAGGDDCDYVVALASWAMLFSSGHRVFYFMINLACKEQEGGFQLKYFIASLNQSQIYRGITSEESQLGEFGKGGNATTLSYVSMQ